MVIGKMTNTICNELSPMLVTVKTQQRAACHHGKGNRRISASHPRMEEAFTGKGEDQMSYEWDRRTESPQLALNNLGICYTLQTSDPKRDQYVDPVFCGKQISRQFWCALFLVLQ